MRTILEQLYPVKMLWQGALPLVVSLLPCRSGGISQKGLYSSELAVEQG